MLIFDSLVSGCGGSVLGVSTSGRLWRRGGGLLLRLLRRMGSRSPFRYSSYETGASVTGKKLPLKPYGIANMALLATSSAVAA
jgi:hypothetical protein